MNFIIVGRISRIWQCKTDDDLRAHQKAPKQRRGEVGGARTRVEFGTINKRHLAVGEFDSKLQDHRRRFRFLKRKIYARDAA